MRNVKTPPSSEAELDRARERLTRQVLGAKTLPEVLAATEALREWMRAHPEEDFMRDGFEQLAQMQEIAEEEEAQRARQTAVQPVKPPVPGTLSDQEHPLDEMIGTYEGEEWDRILDNIRRNRERLDRQVLGEG
jgi:hypothetical protein